MTFLSTLKLAPRDPIFGVTERFNADPNSYKVNLGVGVYYDDDGKVPLLACVCQAEKHLLSTAGPKTYQPIEGQVDYHQRIQDLVFGQRHAAVQEKRVVTVQSLGGTGALKLGADFLKHFAPKDTTVWISDPSWENHGALFEMAGFAVQRYPYYDPHTHGVDFSRMLETFHTLPRGTVVVLHACCHNPTGVDLNQDQWQRLIELIAVRGLIPFLDMAYQGFANSLDADTLIVKQFAHAPLEMPLFVANSFSKSFSLYGERIGALSIVTSQTDEAVRVLSQLKCLIRTNYSNPPLHGSQLVATILASPELRALWESELSMMRSRIQRMRKQFVDKLKQACLLEKSSKKGAWDFVLKQNGLFSYSGLSKVQTERLRDEFSVYVLGTGRICVAALNTHTIDIVVAAIAEVL